LIQRRRRALVVRVGALGDVLLTRRLTYSLSLAGIGSTLLAPSRHASLLLADPWIDAVLDSESPRFAGAFAGSWPGEGGFDVAVLISNSEGLAEAVHRAATQVLHVSPMPERESAPIAQQWAEAAHSICAPFAGTLPPIETDAGEALVSGATLIHAGSGSPDKNWPIERFLDLGRTLGALGHRVAWIRGPAEASLPEEISPGQTIDRPSLKALAATLGQSRLYVGNDSGVSHLAAAVGGPPRALVGPTPAARWRPDGPRVRTLASRSGTMAGLPVDAVVAAAHDLARLSPTGRA
jgi:ADP-heptose:LPS heptosyltransferase